MCAIAFLFFGQETKAEAQCNARPFQSSSALFTSEKKRNIIGKEVLKTKLEMKAEGKEERAEIKSRARALQ